MVAFALRADGWYLRQDIIWKKVNPMPESVTDRCTKAHEYIFLLSKSEKYYYDHEAIKEPSVGTVVDARRGDGGQTAKAQVDSGLSVGNATHMGGGETRNKRSVWSVSAQPFKGAHFATYPEALITPCILAGCPKGGIVLDPFMGAGTTAIVAVKNGRKYLGCELNSEFVQMAEERIQKECGMLLMDWET